jgi:hypothetical protein
VPIAHVVGAAATGLDPDTVHFPPVDSTGATFGIIASEDWDAYSDPTTISDNLGNTWTELPAQSVHDAGLGQQSRIFFCANPIVGPGHTISISRTQLSGSGILDFFSGTASIYPVSAYGGTAADFGTSAIQPGPMSPDVDGSLIYVGVCSPSPGVTISDGFTTPVQISGDPDHYSAAAGYLIQGTAATINPTVTYPGADGLCATYIVVRPSLVPVGSGLQAWYPCDEGSGSIAHDRTGNANNATLENGAAFVTGQQGSAIRFFGANQVAITAFQGPNINNDITIAMWIRRLSFNRGGLLAKTNGTTWNYDLIISFGTNDLTFYSDNLFPNNVSSNPSVVASTNVWYHVAVTHALNGQTIFYVDGVAAGGNPQANQMNVSGGELINIGSEGDPGSPSTNFFEGDIYDVRIYDRVLTPAEIATLATTPGSTHRQMGIGIGLMLR